MLRQVFIVLNDKLEYQRSYAKGLDISIFTKVVEKVKKAALSKSDSETGIFEFFEYKLSYIHDADFNLLLVFVSGFGDDFQDIEPQLKKFKQEFLDFYGDNINNESFEIIYEVLDPIIDIIHRNLKPKKGGERDEKNRYYVFIITYFLFYRYRFS